MSDVNEDFKDKSVTLFVDYISNLTKRAIFDNNMQYPEFIYIFSDKDEMTIPSQNLNMNRNLYKVK